MVLSINAAVPIASSVLKLFVEETRPEGSCVSSFGMPSGHAASAAAWLVHSIVWGWYGSAVQRYRPSARVWISLMALLIFAPIPWSRVHLKDHSSWQCVVGILMGASVQGLWMLLLPWTWRADTSTRHFFIDEVSHAMREKNERRSFLRQASDDVRLPRTYQDTENIDETASLISSSYRIPASTIA